MTHRYPSLPVLAVALGLATAGPLRAQQAGGGAILGWWDGSSICVKAEWNAACTDETVVYRFEPSTAQPARITLHAFKVLNGTPEPMYDLDFVYDSAARQWNGDFDNSRVSIRWSYRVQGDDLTGTVVFRNSGQIGRNVTARRRAPPGN
jgi:hypothetical protein